jgi:hypothetical protein
VCVLVKVLDTVKCALGEWRLRVETANGDYESEGAVTYSSDIPYTF